MTMKKVLEYDVELAEPLIKKYEGLMLHAYRCPAGIWTIGYGHTKGVKKDDRITTEQAENYLYQDLLSTRDDLASITHVDVTEGMFIGLMSFVYNIGVAKCRNDSLFKALNEGNYAKASSWFPRYCYAGKTKLAGLEKRRLEEQRYFDRDGYK